MGYPGTFLAEPVWDKEEIFYANLNRSDLIEAKVRSNNALLALNYVIITWFALKMDFDPVGSYSRPHILYGAFCHVPRLPYTYTETPKTAL